MTSIQLTAPLIDYELTAQERPSHGVEALVVYNDDTRITRGGNTRITRGGNTRVAHNSTLGYPISLTAPPMDYELTAQERP